MRARKPGGCAFRVVPRTDAPLPAFVPTPPPEPRRGSVLLGALTVAALTFAAVLGGLHLIGRIMQ